MRSRVRSENARKRRSTSEMGVFNFIRLSEYSWASALPSRHRRAFALMAREIYTTGMFPIPMVLLCICSGRRG